MHCISTLIYFSNIAISVGTVYKILVVKTSSIVLQVYFIALILHNYKVNAITKFMF